MFGKKDAAQALAEGAWYEQLETFLSDHAKPLEETASALYKAPRQTAESGLKACVNFVYQHPHAVAMIMASTILLGFTARKAYKDGWLSKAKEGVKYLQPGLSMNVNFFGFNFGAYAKPGVAPGADNGLGALLALGNAALGERSRNRFD